MSFNLIKIIHEMSWFALGIAGALVAMAASLAVFVERLRADALPSALRAHSPIAAGALLRARDHRKLADQADATSGAPLAALLGAGVKSYLAGTADAAGQLGPVGFARREVARRIEALGAEARRGMGILASVGSIAPFVGLLGTVVIISAFEGIAAEGSAGLGAISAGIAEALVVTALGLLVAIPAVLAFNYLSARIDALLLALNHAGGEFIDHPRTQYADSRTRRLRRRRGSRQRLGGGTLAAWSDRWPPSTSVKPDINVTPLVDVVLVLLIIFMVVAPRMEKGVSVDVPGILNVDPKTGLKHEPLILSLTAKGSVYLEDRQLETATMMADLRDVHKAQPERRLVLKADRAARYGDVRTVFKQCQDAGFPGVALQVGEKKKPGAAPEGGS